MNIEIQSIQNHGDQTKEVVTLKVLNACDVGRFILFDSTYTLDGKISNRLRHSYWFPDKQVKEGDFIVLHTCSGKQTDFQNKAKTTTHVFYWDLKEPVWNDAGDCAVLVEIGHWKHMKAGK